jgi:hypothetical protein
MPTLYVKINWSESNIVNSKLTGEDFYPIVKVNKVLRQVANRVAAKNEGYDKTSFTLLVWDGSDDDLSEYTGRIDLGTDQDSYGPNMIQEHVKQFCSYNAPKYEGTDYGKEMMWWKNVVS